MDLLIARTTIDLPGQYNRFKLQLDELLVQEPLIDTIYLVPDSGWYIATTEVSLLKETLDEFIDKDKNRIRGKGTLVFNPGALQGPEDAEWFNIRGWNVKIR